MTRAATCNQWPAFGVEAIAALRHHLEKSCAICIVQKDGLTPIASGGEVIHRV